MIYTNYCRQFIHQYTKGSSPYDKMRIPKDEQARRETIIYRDEIINTVNLCKQAQKFMLPENGVMHADYDLRALDDSLELRLPYPVIALEFYRETKDDILLPNKVRISRFIYLLSENGPNNIYDINFISSRCLVYSDHHKMWSLYSYMDFPTVGYFTDLSGTRAINVRTASYGEHLKESCKLLGFTEESIVSENLSAEFSSDLFIIFNFLNIMQCQNISVERLPPKKSFTGQGKGNSLPFDSYNVLTVGALRHRDKREGVTLGGSHASPREHLRRGHIRRYQDGKTVWVNATVVNPGIGGKIVKDYRYEK